MKCLRLNVSNRKMIILLAASIFYIISAIVVQIHANADVTKQTEVTFKVSDYSTKEIKINGQYFSYCDVSKQIFTTANKAALQGAQITATLKGNVLTKVSSITLNAAGTSSKALIFEAPVNIDRLTLNANYLVIKNLTVKKKVSVSQNVTADVQFEKASLNGELFIEESKSTATVNLQLKNAPVKLVIVERGQVKLVSNVTIPQIIVGEKVEKLQIDGTVLKVTIEDSSKLALSGTTTINHLQILNETNLTINTVGNIKQFTVKNSKAKITMNYRLLIGSLELPYRADVTNIVYNYTWAKNYIEKIVVGGELWKASYIKTIDYITISSLPTKLNYVTTESVLDLTGMTVLASSNNVKSVITGYWTSAVDLTKVGSQSVTVYYNGQTTNFTITISAPKTIYYQSSGTISNLPYGVTYSTGHFTITSFSGTSFTFKDGTQSMKAELVKGNWITSVVK